MKNYINLNGTKIKLTPEQIIEMQKSFGVNQITLSKIKTGETFKIAEHEFIVLEHSKDTTAVILKDLLFEDKKFGETNNYQGSYVDELCKDFATKISNIIGDNNLITHTVDLTADDGLKCYGSTQRKMSLISANLYRRYVYILDKYKVKKWWWTCTAYSTSAHSDTSWIKCVSPIGNVNSNYYSRNIGVRPFCILKSNLFVSK